MSKKISVVSHIAAGFTAVLVGYTSSLVIIMQAATAAGATPSQIESWFLALGIVLGLTSIAYSWCYKTPILTAWSTPGAAVLIGSVGQYELPVVIGSFVFSGFLIFVTGLISPISSAIQRIPASLATAMLGAILMPFCIQAFKPVTTMPEIFLCIFLAFITAKRIIPKYTMLILLIVGLACAYFLDSTALSTSDLSFAQPNWVTPEIKFSAILNISIPLYLVTMLSQNLPGIAMMRSYQYDAPTKPILIGTGLSNIVSAPFGGFSVNLAAISAAICLTEEVDSDKSKRYLAVIWAGVFYILAGLLATSIVSIFLSFPVEISQMLAGFALLGALLMCLANTFGQDDYREPALMTFLVTISGISFLGVSSTLWGLIVGWLFLMLKPSNK